MSNRAKALLAIALLTSTWGGVEFIRGWAYSRPNFDWIDVQMDTYQASIPSHWTRSDPDRNPRLDRSTLLIRSNPPVTDLDPFRRSILISDDGVSAKDIDSHVSEMRQNGEDQSSIDEIRLANGLVAKTWTGITSMVEFGSQYRVYAFKAPNGHIYSATHDVPQGWKYEWRYNRLFRRILGSMKFKDAPAPATHKAR